MISRGALVPAAANPDYPNSSNPPTPPGKFASCSKFASSVVLAELA